MFKAVQGVFIPVLPVYRCTGVPLWRCTGVTVLPVRIGVPVYHEILPLIGVPVYHGTKPSQERNAPVGKRGVIARSC